MPAQVDFCGEIYTVDSHTPLSIGRTGRLAIDDNPHLDPHFLEISESNSLVWLANLGSQLSVTVSDHAGLMQAWLVPGTRIPLVFRRSVVWFTAGPTTYEFDVLTQGVRYEPVKPEMFDGNAAAVGRLAFTPDQKRLLVVLAEDVLRHGGRGTGTIPSSADAAIRLGWTLTKFNRKLDNVCEKLHKRGVRGLYGGQAKLATSRRARLVEYALAAQLVGPSDLALLAAPSGTVAGAVEFQPGRRRA
jgi:hypothetical protein